MLKFTKKYLPALLIMILFISSTFFAQNYTNFFLKILGEDKMIGGVIYIFGVVIAIVAAPLTSIPFIPILVSVWGVFWTAILSIIGWILGSIIAFWIAREFGVDLVRRFMDIEKIQKKYSNLPEKKLFWLLLFLRMVTPVDILSYALGLFTKISWKMYLVTTIIGVIPMTFVLAYLGSLPVFLQVIFFIAGVIAGLLYLVLNRKNL